MFNLHDRARIVDRSEDLRPANGLVDLIGLTDMRRLAERGSYGVSVTLLGKRYSQYVFCNGDELVMAPESSARRRRGTTCARKPAAPRSAGVRRVPDASPRLPD